jgi:YidC/Oxa1 family membrane protein insertase
MPTALHVCQVLEGGLNAAGVPYSYGFAIILLTLLVKAATYPLSKKSVSRTGSQL